MSFSITSPPSTAFAHDTFIFVILFLIADHLASTHHTNLSARTNFRTLLSSAQAICQTENLEVCCGRLLSFHQAFSFWSPNTRSAATIRDTKNSMVLRHNTLPYSCMLIACKRSRGGMEIVRSFFFGHIGTKVWFNGTIYSSVLRSALTFAPSIWKIIIETICAILWHYKHIYSCSTYFPLSSPLFLLSKI